MEDTIYNQPTYYSITPASVRYNRNLCPGAKLLYGELTCLMNKYGFCFSKNEYFSRLYETSDKTISRWINDLKNNGHIKTTVHNTKDGYVRIAWLPETDLKIVAKNLKKLIEEKPMDKNVHRPIDKNVHRPMDKNVLCYYNIINSIITSSNKEVVDSEESTNCDEDNSTGSFDKKTLSEQLSCKFVEYWKSKKNLRNHKNNSKTYMNAAKLFILVKSGRFGKAYDLNDKYMSDNKISPGDLLRPLSDDEIFEAIDRFDKMHEPEYGSSSGYPKDCDKFIYNPNSGSSFFYSKLGKGKDPIPSKERSLDEKVVKLYQESLFGKNLNGEEIASLNRGTNIIYRKRKEYYNKLSGCLIPSRMRDDSFFKTHIAFLREKYQDSGRLSVDTLKRKDIWSEYIIWLRKVHKINLEPSDEEINKAKVDLEEKTNDKNNSQVEDEMEKESWEKKKNSPCSEGVRSRYQLSASEV